MTYKYFSQKEIDTWKLDPKLWDILDKAREISATPYIITSGFRTVEHNRTVGGVPHSSHLTGLAADISCTNNKQRAKILWGLMNFYEQLFIEICSRHIHVDMCSDYHAMGSVMWSKDD